MYLNESEAGLIFSIMRDLSGEFDEVEVRQRVGKSLLELLGADYFTSYVWDQNAGQFASCVQINMTDENLRKYDTYYQFHDPITQTLQRRKKATPVSAIMRHDKLAKTEFFNDFLKPDGLCYGMNFFAYDRGDNIGDLRIWRSANREDFTSRDAEIVDAIGPSLVNALIRARNDESGIGLRRFGQMASKTGFTTREAEVADILVAGLSDQEICDKLIISKPTLRTHISSIFRKSGLTRRSQLAQYLSMTNHHS